jgi:hypothetical protein
MDLSEVAIECLPNNNLKFKIITDTGQDLSFKFYNPTDSEINKLISDFYFRVILPELRDYRYHNTETGRRVYGLYSFIMIYTTQIDKRGTFIEDNVNYIELKEEVRELRNAQDWRARRLERQYNAYMKSENDIPAEKIASYKTETYRFNLRNANYGLIDEEPIVEAISKLVLKLPGKYIRDIEKCWQTKEYIKFTNKIVNEVVDLREKINSEDDKFTPEKTTRINTGIKTIIEKYKKNKYKNLFLIQAYLLHLDQYSMACWVYYERIKKKLSFQEKMLYRLQFIKPIPKFGIPFCRPPFNLFGPYVPADIKALYNIPIAWNSKKYGDKEALKLFVKVLLYPRRKWKGGETKKEKRDLKRQLKKKVIETLKLPDYADYLRGDYKTLARERASLDKEFTTRYSTATYPKGGKKPQKWTTCSLNDPIGEEGDTALGDLFSAGPLGLLQEQKEANSNADELKKRVKKIKYGMEVLGLLKENPKRSYNDIAQTLQSQGVKISRPTVTRTIHKFRKILKAYRK